jgi:hypothetical protein
MSIECPSGAPFRHVAEHPSESFFGPRAVPTAPAPIIVLDSESEPESDAQPEPPEDYEPPSLSQSGIPPVDVTKTFGYGCAPAGMYVGPHHDSKPVWWTDSWEQENSQRNDHPAVIRTK